MNVFFYSSKISNFNFVLAIYYSIIIFKTFLLYLLFFFGIISVTSKKNANIKICICTLGKKENRYIREFVEYYKKLGVDKIFLYDNNNKKGEHFEEVIIDYIKQGFVKVLNWRGIKKPHFKMLNDCYIKNNKQYNWLIFYDIDEYIHLDGYNNIKDFLSEKKFNNCKKIYLNWVFHTDNNLINYENKTLNERFPELERDAMINKNFSQKVKTILRGNISNFLISNISHTSHIITNSVQACNGFGKKIKLNKEYFMINSDSKFYYIDHYFTKSLEEFIGKIKRGSAVHGKDEEFQFFRVIRYFYINQFKDKKYKYILDKLKLSNLMIN